MTWRVPLADLDFNAKEKEAVLRVLESRWLTMGEVTQRFEHAFAEYIGVSHAIGVASATVGLHLAVRAVGVHAGDEVLVPSLSFVATSNAVLYEGARPVFCDIAGDNDFSIDAGALENAITLRTKAIIVMHYGGHLCDMPAVLEIAKRHDLAVIEDAAHAPGASLDGRKAGVWGKIAVFSFFSNKNLAMGEGGMIATHDDEIAERIRLMRSHGMTTLSWDRHKGHAHSYDVIDLGFNYRIDEIRSAIGLVQLEKLEENNERRRKLTELYRAHLSEVAGIAVPYVDHPGISSAHLFPIILDPSLDRAVFMDTMKAKGVQTSIHYPPIHTFTYYRQLYGEGELPNTEGVGRREVTLPLYPTMTEDQLALVVEAVQDSLSQAVT